MRTQPSITPKELGSNDIKPKIRGSLIRALIGIPVGGLGGFILGVVGWLAFAHVVLKNPLTTTRDTTPADLVVFLTGPLGALAGAIAGGILFRRLRTLTLITIIAVLAVLGCLFAWAFRIGV